LSSASLGRRMRDGRAKPRPLLSAKDPVPERKFSFCFSFSLSF